MKRFKTIVAAIIGSASFAACGTDDGSETYENVGEVNAALETVLDNCQPPAPATDEELKDVPRDPESISNVLPDGHYIDVLKDGDPHHPSDAHDYTHMVTRVQRLTPNTWMIMQNVFQSLVYVNPNYGILMMDCGGSNGGLPPYQFITNEKGELVLDANGFPQLVLDENGFPIFLPGGQELVNIENALRDIAAEFGKDYDTNLPLKALVLSHPHTDHVGHSVALKEKYPDLRIITSKQMADRVRMDKLAIALGDDGCYDHVNAQPKENCSYPPPWRIPRKREIIYDRFGKFKFGGETFHFWTPEMLAHSAADSLLFTPDGVHMSVDMLGTEGRLSFVSNSVGAYTAGIIRINRYLLGAAGYECDVTDPTVIDEQTGLTQGEACFQAGPTKPPMYKHVLSGHFNASYDDDVVSTLRYYRASTEKWWPALFGATQGGNPKSPHQYYNENIHFVDRLIMGIFTSQPRDMSILLAPQYATHGHWGSANWDFQEVNQDMFLYHNSGGNTVTPINLQNPSPPPGGTIDFSPIAPYTVPDWGRYMPGLL